MKLDSTLKLKDKKVTKAPKVQSGDKTALATLMSEAQKWDAKAQFALDVLYDEGKGVLKDEKQAVDWYRKAAENGIAEAQFNLGVSYAKGQGVAQDNKQAVQWYRKAVEQGDADAQRWLDRLKSKHK